jgi:two-component system, NarL family, response regulator LiaR
VIVPPIRVLVVDDHALVREGLIRLLEQVPTLLPVGQAASGLEAVECARESQPDAALIDLWLPELDGLETTRRLLEVCPQLRILLLGEAESEEIALRALRIGAFGYVLKTQPFGAVARAIEVAMDGSVTLPRDVAYRALVRERVPTSHDSDRASHAAASLTEREWQILNGIAAGESNRRIAIRLVISEHTVRAHVRNLMKKLGVGTRAQAAAVAAGYLGDEVGARNGGTIP